MLLAVRFFAGKWQRFSAHSDSEGSRAPCQKPSRFQSPLKIGSAFWVRDLSLGRARKVNIVAFTASEGQKGIRNPERKISSKSPWATNQALSG
jgi:hypothetical protein